MNYIIYNPDNNSYLHLIQHYGYSLKTNKQIRIHIFSKDISKAYYFSKINAVLTIKDILEHDRAKMDGCDLQITKLIIRKVA
jgi:hypothetical protein